jgi:hypothetical protein
MSSARARAVASEGDVQHLHPTRGHLVAVAALDEDVPARDGEEVPVVAHRGVQVSDEDPDVVDCVAHERIVTAASTRRNGAARRGL